MPKTTYSHVKLEGWVELQKRLDMDSILAQGDWRRGMTETVQALYAKVRDWSPLQSGATQAASTWEVQRVGVPKWGRVSMVSMPTKPEPKKHWKVNRKTKYPFRYPGALQGSRAVQFRYRSGPHKGQLTIGWFSKARGRAQRAMNAIMAATDARIRQAWDRVA